MVVVITPPNEDVRQKSKLTFVLTRYTQTCSARSVIAGNHDVELYIHPPDVSPT